MRGGLQVTFKAELPTVKGAFSGDWRPQWRPTGKFMADVSLGMLDPSRTGD